MSTDNPPPVVPPPAPSTAPAGRPVDTTVTVVLIIVLALGGALSLFFGLFFAMAAANCADQACSDQVGRGVLVIELAPVLAWVPTTIWAVVRMRRGQSSFWVPLLALPIYLVVLVAGFALFPR